MLLRADDEVGRASGPCKGARPPATRAGHNPGRGMLVAVGIIGFLLGRLSVIDEAERKVAAPDVLAPFPAAMADSEPAPDAFAPAPGAAKAPARDANPRPFAAGLAQPPAAAAPGYEPEESGPGYEAAQDEAAEPARGGWVVCLLTQLLGSPSGWRGARPRRGPRLC